MNGEEKIILPTKKEISDLVTPFFLGLIRKIKEDIQEERFNTALSNLNILKGLIEEVKDIDELLDNE